MSFLPVHRATHPRAQASRSISLVLSCSLLPAAMSGAVHGETTDCMEVPTVPFTIDIQGVWCFRRHLTSAVTAGNIITIAVNNVTLDLNGYKLGGLAAGPETDATGIYANERKNITVRNGTVRGFRYGILFDGASSQGHRVEDIQADSNTAIGLFVRGSGHTLTKNRLRSTGNDAVVWPAAIVIENGAGNRVIDNDISNVAASNPTGAAGAMGIKSAGNESVIIEGNRINWINAEGTSGWARGIYSDNDVNPIIRTNIISDVRHDTQIASGIQFAPTTVDACALANDIVSISGGAGDYGIWFEAGSTGGYGGNTVVGGSALTDDYAGGSDLSAGVGTTSHNASF